MKDTKKLIETLENMIDHDCKIVVGDSFKYIWGKEEIQIDPDEGYMDNLEWKKFLQKEFNFTLNHKNWFILSVLHELGHHYTLDLFDEETVRKSQHGIGKNQNEHFYEQVEVVATDWAVSYYRLANMEEWEDEVTALL